MKQKVLKNNYEPQGQPNWAIIGLISISIAIIFFQPFLDIIFLSALIALLLYPIHRRLTKYLPDDVSAVIILVFSTLVIIIPLIIILFFTISQTISFAKMLANINVSEINNMVVTNINSLFAKYGINDFIGNGSMAELVNKTFPQVINHVVNAAMGFFGNLPKLFTSVIVYCFLFLAFLKYGKNIPEYIKSILPFDEDSSDKYITKSSLIVTASLKGQFIISFVTAVSSSLLLFLLGLQQYFFFFVIILTLLGMVPLGSGIVIIPITIIAMILGDFWAGLWVLVIYLAVICNIDTILRPRLIPKKANIIPALTTLATFCGIYYFGTMGIIYGPLIVIVLLTTSEIYISTRKKQTQTT